MVDESTIVMGSTRKRLGSIAWLSALTTVAFFRIDEGWLWLVFLALGAICLAMSLVSLFNPDRLEIGADGFVERSVFGTVYWRWPEVQAFRVEKEGRSCKIRYDRIAAAPLAPRWRRWTALHHWLVLRSEDFSTEWRLPPEQVVDLLNESRARWAMRTLAQEPPKA